MNNIFHFSWFWMIQTSCIAHMPLCFKHHVLLCFFPVASDLMYIPYAPVPVPVKLHKMEMEFQTGVGGWKIVSFIRNTVASEAASEHNAVFKIEEGSSEIISVEAVMKTEGRTLRNMIVRNAVSGKGL